MKKLLALVCAPAILALSAFAGDSKEESRVENSGRVLKEVLGIPESIPKDLLDKAECVAIFPSVVKLAVGIGASYGRGVMTCRTGEHYTGSWSAPSMMALEGGSIGFQLGGEATDFVLLVMNPRGANAILASKVKLGGDASAAAGPKGRTAEANTDVTLRAEILTYSRARGLFAGVSLEGSTLRPDNTANRRLYGRDLSAKEIIREGTVPVPASGQELVSTLNQESPKNLSDPKSLE